jgi:hypothetical protein
MEFHSCLAGQNLHGFNEGDVLYFFNERDCVPAFTASETMPPPRVGPYMEGWRFFVVERAQPFQRIHAGWPKRDVSGDDVVNARARTHLINILAFYQPCHTAILVA